MSWSDELTGSVQQMPPTQQGAPMGQQGQNPMQKQQDMMMMAQALRGMGQQQRPMQTGRIMPASQGIDFQGMMGPAMMRQFGG